MTPRRLAAILAASLPASAARGAPYFDFHASSAVVASRCAAAKDRAEARLKALAATPAASATFKDGILAFSDIDSDLTDATQALIFLSVASPDAGVRAAGTACGALVDGFRIKVLAREDIYRVLKASSKERLEGEDARLRDKILSDFKRNGLELPPERRARLTKLGTRILELQNAYQKRLFKEETVPLARAQLNGLSADFIARLPRDGDGYKVPLDYFTGYLPFMENARDAEARRAVLTGFESRGGPENGKILADILRLRVELAALLGYPSFAAYALEERMAKNPETALSFLRRLSRRLAPKGRAELAALAELKNEELKGKSDGVIHAWDLDYYSSRLLKTRYGVDDAQVSEYFPVDGVTAGLLEVYQALLGLTFREIRPADAWAPEVRLFAVADSSGGRPIGYFYLDIFSREGKIKNAAFAMSLLPGRLPRDGNYRAPVSVILANFKAPTAGTPSLLSHREVVIFFHEFGHVMHQVLSRAKYERLSAMSVAKDFLEAPSQMLENWVWREEVLTRLSGHYKNPSRKLPKELLKRMLAAKNADAGLRRLNEAFFATADLTLHMEPGADIGETWAKLQREIGLVPMAPGTMLWASFTHLLGYAAGYYGYLWSEVYAADMFSRFEKEGVLNEALGREYRRKILEPGAGADEGDMLRSFLGREPDEEAFLRGMGL